MRKDYASIVTLPFVSHVSRAHCGLLLPACGEKVGMRGRFRESELVEAPLTGPRSGFRTDLGLARDRHCKMRKSSKLDLRACCPPPASGARKTAPLSNRSKCQARHTSSSVRDDAMLGPVAPIASPPAQAAAGAPSPQTKAAPSSEDGAAAIARLRLKPEAEDFRLPDAHQSMVIVVRHTQLLGSLAIPTGRAVARKQTPPGPPPLQLFGRSCQSFLYWSSRSARQNTGLVVPFRLVPQDNSAVRSNLRALPNAPA